MLYFSQINLRNGKGRLKVKVVLKHVDKEFPSKTKGADSVFAVKDFDFEFPEGKLVGLLGPSGCGKSTTLNLISGLLRPTKGEIFFDSIDMTNTPAEKRGVGLVFQNYALYPHLSVLNNILFPLQNLKGKDKLTKEEMLKRAHDAAELVEISHLLDRKPASLSGGQQQRVAIARALVKKPNVLLLDEPLSNLDARLRLQTREEIRRIQKETKVTTIFVTHDQDEAMSISDLIVVMNEGSIQQIGAPQEVYDNPKNLFVAKFLGIPPINVFDGEIRENCLYIGDEKITSFAYGKNTAVKIAIRPEGLIPSEDGVLSAKFSSVEVMGRDISVIAQHPASSGKIRAIVSSVNSQNICYDSVKFSVAENKLFVFDSESGERLLAGKSQVQEGKSKSAGKTENNKEKKHRQNNSQGEK